MSATAVVDPHLVHAVPGRARVCLPDWSGPGQRSIEAQFRRVAGVRSAQGNPLTGNVLVRYDPAVTNEASILAAARTLAPEVAAEESPSFTAPPPAHVERHGETRRARIAVRGLDRDPGLAGRVVDRLQERPGVLRASASPLTGRVLVEYADADVTLEDLLGDVSDLELPAVPGEERPAHPLDHRPLVRSGTRASGAALGLGLLAAERLVSGAPSPAGATGPAVVAGLIGVLDSFPTIRGALARLLGSDVVDLVLNAAGIASMTLARSPLGLAVVGLEALRSFTEVRARQAAWRTHEAWTERVPLPRPGAVIRLEAGGRCPLGATVLEGTGTAVGADGLPVPAVPGSLVDAGAPLYGGPFTLELRSDGPFEPEPRPVPVPESISERYVRAAGPLSLAYAALTTLATRSLSRAFAALLLVNGRPAMVGAGAADSGASARLLRAGVTVVGTRPDRPIRLTRVLLLDGPRVLTDGVELASVLPLTEAHDMADVLERAGALSAAAGSPWGNLFPVAGQLLATSGSFDGKVATASVEGLRYSLGPVDEAESVRGASHLRDRGDYALLLRREHDGQALGLLAVRPRLKPGVADLTHACQRHGVEIALLAAEGQTAAQAVARRAGMPFLGGGDAPAVVRARQAEGALVAFVSDRGDAGAAFAACDLAIGVLPRGGSLAARVDLLAVDLGAVAAIVMTGALREAAVRDSVILSAVANGLGAVWGLRSRPGIGRAPLLVSIASLGALAVGWARTRGGPSPKHPSAWAEDPHPEHWGRQDIASVLRAFGTTESGLTSAQAVERRRPEPSVTRKNRLLTAVVDQIRSPLTGILAAGAGLSLILGAPADVVMIGAMIVANSAAGAWQESRASQAAEALDRMGAATAQVLRDGASVVVSAVDVVPGDVLLLTPGTRVVADARLLEVQGLELDEAALTGESLPIRKTADEGNDGASVILEGSDVTVGSGRAVVVAVGQDTRLGATAAALALDDTGQSPLGVRLNRMLRQVLPIAAAGGSIVALSGIARGLAPLPQLAVGASIAIAAVPEGLPLLAKIGEAAVARRLARRHALVHRLAAVEALGRVDVACTDKTGTLTEGRLRLSLVADLDEEVSPSPAMAGRLRNVLLTAALAGPHPDALDAATDRTDVAVVEGARLAGAGDELCLPRDAQLPFDAARAFHAAVVQGRLCVEGAAEALVPRCAYAHRNGCRVPLDDAGRDELLARARAFAGRGLRVLMVAEGPPGGATDDPDDLVALGFLGISDPLRPSVAAAVRRCHDAGVRVVMVTGDHPATARAIAREAGLHNHDDILTGPEIVELSDPDLDRRLERVGVIARATALDKLRIVEGLQRLGHTVAMTGDGINDAPALRLADVGVAMGRGGTEVARQAADVVLADDDFSTLVEALVEGRSFWRNIRRALGLLLGGNLGELGLQVGASLLGLASPLTSRQILAVNLITDVLPALAVALQQPEHHNLAGLAREGTSALDAPLRTDIVRRAVATAGPSFAAYAVALRSGGMPVARTVAFASIVTTQLAQTLDVGRGEDGRSRTVLAAVAGASGLLVATVAIAPLRGFLGLALPTPLGSVLVAAASLAAVLLSRGRALPGPPGLGAAMGMAPPTASSA